MSTVLLIRTDASKMRSTNNLLESGVPLEELEHRLSELPKNQEIVAYCRGPYCVLTIEAVELLRARGFQAIRLEDGIQDWRSRGFRVAVDEEP